LQVAIGTFQAAYNRSVIIRHCSSYPGAEDISYPPGGIDMIPPKRMPKLN
jgi:hypothetical protein